jgi:hypothetical protein
VKLVPARGRARGPGPSLPWGLTSIELVVGLAVAGALLAATATGAFQLKSALAVRSAAAELSAGFLRARAYALTKGISVALKFRKDGGRWEWALFRDGNGNGVRNAEIASGVDRSLGLAIVWPRADVVPGILKGTPVPDPGSPGSTLDRLDDPIRFNSSDLCSFSPLGESTPGSVYLWDGRDRMAVVRVFGRSAKVRTLFHYRGEKSWRK